MPAVDDEDRRQLHRELIELKAERTAHVNAIKGLLAGLGLQASVDDDFPERLEKLRQWDGTAVPAGLRQRLLREFERWQMVGRQIAELEKQRTHQIRKDKSPEVGEGTPVAEPQGDRRERGVAVGQRVLLLAEVPEPPRAGEPGGSDADAVRQRREPARARASARPGNRRVRWMMVQLAWGWLQYQPESELSQWYQRRFGHGNARQRKIGIVALARKLLIALWKYLETGEPPAGAEVIGWDKKPKFAGAGAASKAS